MSRKHERILLLLLLLPYKKYARTGTRFYRFCKKKSTRIISRSVSYRARKKSKTSIEYYNSGELYRTRRRGIPPPQSNTIKKYSFAKTSRRVVLNKSVNGFNSFKVRRSSGDEIDSELDDTMTTYLLGRVRQNTSV